MNDPELEELRQLLALKADAHRSHTKIVDDDEPPGIQNMLREVAEAEIAVFGLDEDLAAEMQVAWMAYDAFTGAFGNEQIGGLAYDLIIRLRDDIPHRPRLTHAVQGFVDAYDDDIDFRWFAKKAMNIPNREAYRWYYRFQFNMIGLASFPDEGE